MPRKERTDMKQTCFEKKYGLPSSVRKLKITNKIKTVNDLLTRSDINETLDELSRNKSDINDLIILYTTSDDVMHYRIPNCEILKALGMIEYVKDMLLHQEDGE